MKEVQLFLGRGKTKDYALNAAFNALLPVRNGRLRRTYSESLKYCQRIKIDALHLHVMETLQRFIDEDMDFDFGF